MKTSAAALSPCTVWSKRESSQERGDDNDSHIDLGNTWHRGGKAATKTRGAAAAKKWFGNRTEHAAKVYALQV